MSAASAERRGSPAPRRATAAVAVALSTLLAAPPAGAWVYPEHRDIALVAVESLPSAEREAFDALWSAARGSREAALCATGADAAQALTPECIDWAALTAIAGDHACSSHAMDDAVAARDWILVVADVAAQLKLDLATLPVTLPSGGAPQSITEFASTVREQLADSAVEARRLNALRTADTRLQRADPGYALRADANTAHFLPARVATGVDEARYVAEATAAGAPANAIGVYARYHARALAKAARLATPGLASGERATLARAALFDEAFALHFLEDVYAAGHVAGSWGDASQRKGTHDFYNQHGLEAFTWSRASTSVVLMGDAHMRPQDGRLAAEAVRTSLGQVLAAAAGRAGAPPGSPASGPDDYDVCAGAVLPADAGPTLAGTPGERELLATLGLTPVPGLADGLGSIPRFRSELGPFIGLVSSVDARGIDGGFEPSQTQNGFVLGTEIGVRVGMGLEGVLGDAGDGLVFAQLGYRATTPSSNKLTSIPLPTLTGTLGAAVPSEFGPSLRLRAPFYLVPGDLLLLAPLYFVDRDAYTQLAITAANGGRIPWQHGIATRFGRFQFVLGRELGLSFVGLDRKAQLLVPTARSLILRAVNYKAVGVDLPLLEYRPYRRFSTDQASQILFQLYASAEFPYAVRPDDGDGPLDSHLHAIYGFGLRMAFSWRRYW